MQTTLIISRTEDTPEVNFDAENKTFRIEGDSMPEDSLQFYSPIIQWWTEYVEQINSEISIHFLIPYCNTASAKQIARLFTALQQSSNNHFVVIKWYYDKDDVETLKIGKRFEQQLTLKFDFIEHTYPSIKSEDNEGVYQKVN